MNALSPLELRWMAPATVSFNRPLTPKPASVEAQIDDSIVDVEARPVSAAPAWFAPVESSVAVKQPEAIERAAATQARPPEVYRRPPVAASGSVARRRATELGSIVDIYA
jgi:hypothetical protein